MKYNHKVNALNLQQALEEALSLQSQGKVGRASSIYKAILKQSPDQFDALHFYGLLCAQQNSIKRAIKLLSAAVKSEPEEFEAHNNLGNAYQASGNRQEAIKHHRKAIEINPQFPEAYYNLGLALMALENYEAAIPNYETALKLKPQYPQAHNNLGLAYYGLRQVEKAADCYNDAIAQYPEYAEAHNNLGNAFRALNRKSDAIEKYLYALELKPDHNEFLINLGGVYLDSLRPDDAEKTFRRAAKKNSEDSAVYVGLGQALADQRKFDEAVNVGREAYKKGRLDPAGIVVLSQWQRAACDWREIDQLEKKALETINRDEAGVNPFLATNITDSAELLFKCATQFANRNIPSSKAPLWSSETYTHEKIKIAYLSADFRQHAVATMAIPLFEGHDKSRFETYAFSFGVDDKSDMRARIINAFDHFIDIRSLTSQQAAEKLRSLEIDIAVDLTGYTMHGRMDILSHRPAPIQVHYLGFPGSLGTEFIDYMLLDRVVAPEEHIKYFSENIVYLPDCYMISDNTRPLVTKPPSRSDHGLPQDAFVFCSFNTSRKFNATFFDIWMRLLDRVPQSVLWLLGDDPVIEKNLRKEAGHRDIDPERLIFAPRVDYEDYLSRMRCGDLFLDCLPYNAQATANDALWAGLPVLTKLGDGLPSRVAASYLQALGLPKLITQSLEEYEEVALHLATDKSALVDITAKLRTNPETNALFCAEDKISQIETAYQIMWERHKDGEMPATFSV